jgi:hypothetical protein
MNPAASKLTPILCLVSQCADSSRAVCTAYSSIFDKKISRSLPSLEDTFDKLLLHDSQSESTVAQLVHRAS